MNYSARVRVGERARDVAEDAEGFADRQWSARDPLAQRLAVDEGHREPGQPIGLAGREHRDDVRVLESRSKQDLAPKTLDVQPGDELGWQHLDDDGAMERRVSGDEDPRHTAAAELALDRVATRQRGLKLLSKIGAHRRRSESAAKIRLPRVTGQTATRRSHGREVPNCSRRSPEARVGKRRIEW